MTTPQATAKEVVYFDTDASAAFPQRQREVGLLEHLPAQRTDRSGFPGSLGERVAGGQL